MELLRIATVEGEPPVLQVEGEIDISTAEDLQMALDAALSANPNLVIDMAGVTFFDAAGIRVVLRVASSRNGAGPLTLVNAAHIKRVLELVGLGGLPCIVFDDECEPSGR